MSTPISEPGAQVCSNLLAPLGWSTTKNETKEMLGIDIQSSNEVATLVCAGRLVFGVEVEMLRTMVHARPETNLHIDLSEVTRIDAAGLGLLVELQNWAAKTQRNLTLLDLSENVWRLVILTKLCGSLEISYSDLETLNPALDECGRQELIA